MFTKALIVSDDPGFANALSWSWRHAGCVPEYEFVPLAEAAARATICVAVVDGPQALLRLSGGAALAIVVTADDPLPEVEGAMGRVVRIIRREGWADIAAALALESVLREQAMQRVNELENQLRDTERFTALGKIISEAQHGLANALTGLLGHTELLLMDSGLGDESRRKVTIVQAMSMKIYEVLQRLSETDREIRMVEHKRSRKVAGVVSR